MAHVLEKDVAAETGPYLEKFGHFENESHVPAWLFPLRKAGISSFAEQGFPTLHDEDWRYTNVAPIARMPFQPVFDAARNGHASQAMDRLPFAKMVAHRLVFVDGLYSAKLSSPQALPAGV